MNSNPFETYNQLIDQIKLIAAGVEAYSKAEQAKDLPARSLAADALRYRIAELSKIAAGVESVFPQEIAVIQSLQSDVEPMRINSINERLEPFRKALLSQLLRMSVES